MVEMLHAADSRHCVDAWMLLDQCLNILTIQGTDEGVEVVIVPDGDLDAGMDAVLVSSDTLSGVDRENGTREFLFNLLERE